MTEAVVSWQSTIRDAELDSAITRAVTVLPRDADLHKIDKQAAKRVLVPTRAANAACQAPFELGEDAAALS